jgi:sulfite reductase (NADPH) hemoprotein beta-component
VPEVRPERRLLDPERARFLASNVRPQKQAGYVCVSVTVPLGDLSAAQLRVLGQLAEAYADGSVRTGVDQNVFFRFVRADDVAALHERLSAAGLGRAGAGSLADVGSCPGAESCKLAVTQSRGLGHALGEHLRDRPELVEAGRGLDIKISGCPNGCGQHHVAAIGFQGSVRQLGARAVPQYFVMVGGGVDEHGAAHFGKLVAKLPVRRATAAVERLVALYAAERGPGEEGAAFFRRIDLARVKAALGDLETLRPDEARDEDFIDLGDQAAFSVETQAGECAA